MYPQVWRQCGAGKKSGGWSGLRHAELRIVRPGQRVIVGRAEDQFDVRANIISLARGAVGGKLPGGVE